MKVLVYEDNLMWSTRLLNGLKKLGHDPVLHQDTTPDDGDAAIVNLSTPGIDAQKLVPALDKRGVIVIGHAGHKEKNLLELGRAAGCHILATNSQLTNKLEQLLDQV
jgi:selenocysteine lyase/cysteine desulfurase